LPQERIDKANPHREKLIRE